MAQFFVSENLAGKTLKQLGQEASAQGKYVPRLDILAGQLGISESTPLTAGQAFNLPDDPGSGEVQFASSIFTPAGQYQQQQAQSFQEEQRGRQGEFFGRLQAVPEQLEAVRQAMGIPQAFETFGALGEQARGIAGTVRDLPQAVQQALAGQGVSSGQIAGRQAAEIRGLQPAIESATRGLETGGATLENLLSEFTSRTQATFAPFEIEAGLLGESIAQEYGLFKQQITNALDRELEQIRQTGEMDRAQLERATKLAEIEAGAGIYKDLGDRYAYMVNGEEVSSVKKGLAPTRGGGDGETIDFNTLYQQYLQGQA